MSPRFAVAIGALTILVVTVTLWMLPSTSEFSTSNALWNGLQQAREQFASRSVRSLVALPVQPRGTALVVIPAVPLFPRDLDELKQYAAGGGVLILMDNFGFGNGVLSHLGVESRFSGQPLIDPLFAFKNRRFPRVTDLSGPTSEGVGSLVLNNATVLTGTTRMSVLARSSPASFLDRNGNGRRDVDEPLGPFVVAALQPFGRGKLVMISDSSLLLNSMLDLGDNRRFMQQLFHLAGPRAQVYLDEAHLPRAPLDVAKDWLSRVRGVLAFPPLAFIAVAAGVALLWKTPRR